MGIVKKAELFMRSEVPFGCHGAGREVLKEEVGRGEKVLEELERDVKCLRDILGR